MLEHRGSFDREPNEGRARAIERLGIRVTAPGELGFLLLQGYPAEPALHRALQDTENPPLPGPGEVSFGVRRSFVWLAPKEWLLELPRAELESVYAKFTDLLETAHAAVTDVSEAYACFSLTGDSVVSVLSTGCSLDLRRDRFVTGNAARTLLANAPVILFRCRDSADLQCLVDRSYAEHLWNWLKSAPAARRRADWTSQDSMDTRS